MIEEANVTLMVRDIEKSISFYRDVLGLKLKAKYGDQFAQVEAPGMVIALHPVVRERPTPDGPESMSIGFGVTDLDGAMKDLKKKGVEFSRTTDDAQVRLAFFTDPDGTPLYLSQSKWG